MSVKRIGLFGNFGVGNLGNDGSLEAMLLFLREAYPDAGMVCICPRPDIVQERFGIRTLPTNVSRTGNRNLLTKIRDKIADHICIFRNVSNVDVLLIPGTGILDDFGERPIGFPYIIFLICLVAKLRGIKVAFVSAGAGPIRHPVSRWLMKSAARTAAYRSYRDQISKDFMQSLGIDTGQDPVYPDLAFRLPDPISAERPKDNRLTIGLGVMEYLGWAAGGSQEIYDLYIKKLTEFALWLLNDGYRIRLLVGQGDDQRAVDDVTNAVTRELGNLPEGSIVIDTPHSLNDLMEQISDVDAVVATRYHNVLCALKVGRPTISLGYAKKNDVLMAEMGLGEFCQHVEEFDLDLLQQQFKTMIEHRNSYQDIVKTNSANLRQKLLQQEQFLTSRII